MTYSVHNESHIVSPPGDDASVNRPAEAGFYTALGASAHEGISLHPSVAEDYAGRFAPPGRMRFDVTVGTGEDTAGQLDRVLAEMKRRAPDGTYAIQEINVAGTVFTGGAAADLGHNRELALRNEAYVQQYFALAGVRPELGVNTHGKISAEFPGLLLQPEHATRRNAVHVDIVYRRRAGGDPAPKGADRTTRCSKAASALLGTHTASPGLRALSAPPPMAWPDGGAMDEITVSRPAASTDKPWLRRCPVRQRA
ncbi:hypothetical protein [Achromobacter aloeverae]|uniref:OmpA-like domain-containing protein n=1 Tax=Achromobacter aloeverae TaxID=1750518 RepID=A0A4Q1HIH7_9BURK|nr:hypothetical protein [Achromobacter aloeverae]RXN88042.1 hypothetical protein C7R54_15820 [Achromobacter aloeverae]